MGLFGNSALRPVKKLADKVEALSSRFEEMSDDELAAAGISPATVRMSCGLEGTADLVADVEQALAAI